MNTTDDTNIAPGHGEGDAQPIIERIRELVGEPYASSWASRTRA